MQEQSLIVGSIQQRNGLSAHVSLLFDKSLQVYFHRKILEFLRVDDEHGLDEDHRVGIVNVNFASNAIFSDVLASGEVLLFFVFRHR